MDVRNPLTLTVAFPSNHHRALTGVVELELAQIVRSHATRPARVSRVLELMFDRISGQPVSAERVCRLTSSAREWLLQQAALRVWPDKGWFQVRCSTCDRDIDLPLTLAGAPRKPAESGFPVISVNTSLGVRRFEAPNGAHEEALAAARPDRDPVRHLLALCGLDDNAEADAECYTARDLERIEAAFEAACPDVADAVSTTCPFCHATIDALIDPLQFAFPTPWQLLREVHAIAGVYHWSESEILELPSHRRAAYADLIFAEGRGGRHR